MSTNENEEERRADAKEGRRRQCEQGRRERGGTDESFSCGGTPMCALGASARGGSEGSGPRGPLLGHYKTERRGGGGRGARLREK